MSKRRILTFALSGFLLAAWAPTLYAEIKVAVVDLQRALQQTEDGRRAKRQLKALFKRRQAELDKRQNELKKLKEQIEKQKDVLSREALRKKLEDYQKRFVELQSTYVEYQRELAQKEAQLTQRILQRMQRIVRRIGQSQGYTVILEANEGGVLWAPSHIDLTDQVIQRYNRGEGRGE